VFLHQPHDGSELLGCGLVDLVHVELDAHQVRADEGPFRFGTQQLDDPVSGAEPDLGPPDEVAASSSGVSERLSWLRLTMAAASRAPGPGLTRAERGRACGVHPIAGGQECTHPSFRQHHSFHRDLLHGRAGQGRRVQFGLAPECQRASAEPPVGTVAMSDRTDGLRRVRIVQRHVLSVGLRRLTMDGLSVEIGDAR